MIDLLTYPYENRQLKLVWDSSLTASPCSNIQHGPAASPSLAVKNPGFPVGNTNNGSSSTINGPASPSQSSLAGSSVGTTAGAGTGAGNASSRGGHAGLSASPSLSTPWPASVTIPPMLAQSVLPPVPGITPQQSSAPQQTEHGGTAPWVSTSLPTGGSPCLACVAIKAPMSDKLQKQMSAIEPIHEHVNEDQEQGNNAVSDSSNAADASSSDATASVPVKPNNNNNINNNASEFPAADSSTPTDKPKKRKPLVSMNSFSLSSGFSSSSSSSGEPATPANILPLRPKNSIRTTSSNFFLRVELTHASASGFSRMCSNAATNQVGTSRHPERVSLAFWTQGKTLSWCQLPSDAAASQTTQPSGQGAINQAANQPFLTRSYLCFAVPVTALTLNQESASYAAMDLLVACGPDILWIDPVGAKYSRFNKAGVVTLSPVVKLAWSAPSNDAVQRGQTAPTFVSAHADGTIFHWALDRDDPSSNCQIQIPKAGLSWTPQSDLLTWTNPASHQPSDSSNATKKTGPKHNPLVGWRVSKKPITDLAVSPDPGSPGRSLAVTSEDGVLRIIDLVEQRLFDTYGSYFGGLNCVTWSPDGRYCLTGGQDDLVSIYAPVEQRLVHRCQGHMSFVRAIAFEMHFENDTKSSLGSSKTSPSPTTRFASVGEDCRLVLWDLTSATHHHRTLSKLHLANGTRPSQDEQQFTRLSLSSTLSLNTLQRKRTLDAGQPALSAIDDDESTEGPQWHPAPGRRDVGIIKPIASSPIANDLVIALQFVPSGCVVMTKHGSVRLYLRPLPPLKT